MGARQPPRARAGVRQGDAPPRRSICSCDRSPCSNGRRCGVANAAATKDSPTGEDLRAAPGATSRLASPFRHRFSWVSPDKTGRGSGRRCTLHRGKRGKCPDGVMLFVGLLIRRSVVRIHPPQLMENVHSRKRSGRYGRTLAVLSAIPAAGISRSTVSPGAITSGSDRNH